MTWEASPVVVLTPRTVTPLHTSFRHWESGFTDVCILIWGEFKTGWRSLLKNHTFASL